MWEEVMIWSSKDNLEVGHGLVNLFRGAPAAKSDPLKGLASHYSVGGGRYYSTHDLRDVLLIA